MMETEDDIKVALELVCDQLTDSLAQLLLTKFGYAANEVGMKPPTASNNKRKADWEIQLEVSIISELIVRYFKTVWCDVE
jgi:hypothetical protein